MDSDDDNSPVSPPPPSEPPPSLPPPLPARPQRNGSPPQIPSQHDCFVSEADEENDEISQQMTASYSEISVKSGVSPDMESANGLPLAQHIMQRPMTLNCETIRPLNSDGTVHVEGNMTHFVAEDLEYKIKLSSPVTKKDQFPSTSSRSCTPLGLYRQLLAPQVGQLDATLLNDLECEAQRMATSIDNLTENLCGILHSISSITADNVEVYKNAVAKMSDAMDSNIKSMYTMMAKTEEVTQAMKSVQVHAAKIKEIKRLVDLFETYI